MVEGLVRSAADCPNNQVSMHLRRLAEHMQAGESLSGAMRQSPKFFPRYYVDLVGVAETSSQLETTLAGLIYETQSRHEAGNKSRNRCMYIAVVLAYIVFVSSIMSGTVFPVMEQLAVELGGQICGVPQFAARVMDFTGFLSGPMKEANDASSQVFSHIVEGGESPVPGVGVATFLAGGLFALLFAGLALLLFKPAQYLFGHIPGVRRILLHAQWGHALRVLALLLSRGVPLDRALDSASGSDVRGMVRATLLRLGERVRAGQSLSEALKGERRRTPRSLRSAVAFGEHSGCLPDSLSKVAHAYALRSDRAMRMLSNILFPLAIVGCGWLVLIIQARFFGLLCISMDSITSRM